MKKTGQFTGLKLFLVAWVSYRLWHWINADVHLSIYEVLPFTEGHSTLYVLACAAMAIIALIGLSRLGSRT